jgi:homogentisate 1,2-dioxygenase
MADKKVQFEERITIDGKNVILNRTTNPTQASHGVLEYAEIFKLINVFTDKFNPTNIDKGDGTPLRLFESKHTRIEVSKRRKHDMSFWHRNIDAHEIIFCVQGALKWETEMGTRIMKPGDMMMIPRGIAHRSMLCDESTADNVLIELKVFEELKYVGPA